MSARTRVRVSITGVVQGVGFRPTVARIAAAHRVGGFVLNDAGSVQCEFEGPPARVHAAVHTLRTAPPPLAHIDTFVVAPGTALGDRVFRILDSTPGGGDGRTLVAPDIATCPDCLRELFDPTDRRHGHPFITCTNCGPRYTVITDLPYDRPATTMAAFGMCAACAAEYSDPADRRFHAQTIACPDCGPRLAWRGPDDGGSPLDAAAAALRGGLIVSVKGIGGYHLACRADDDEAVARLRQRKNRPAKPFAVMVADIEHARRICVVDDAAERSLTSPAAPIVLLAARPGAVSDAVAPHLRDLGVMLAYSPIHHLLFAGLDVPALVMTSANQGGSPIVYRTEHLGWIDGLADAVLDHDRPIHVPCEDSVVGIDADGNELPLRRSRGFAPLPVPLGVETPATILATGGDLKTTFALTDGHGRAHLSSHLGDMADPRTQSCFAAAVEHLAFLTGRVPDVVAHDAHPQYATTRWAQRHGGRLLAVQHHHAHAVSLLAEHHRLGDPMLAVAFDGTGFGTDGTIWGGELLALTGPAEFTRVGHLAPFRLPGGDGAVRSPARIAVDLLRRAGIAATDDDLPPVAALGPSGMHILTQQLERDLGCVPTTSMGRLFDAVASLLGVCQQVTYEGQAAVELEHLARTGHAGAAVDFDVSAGMLDPTPVVRALVDGLRAGAARADLALLFHDAVIRATVRAAGDAAAAAGMPTVGLTGGVFANRLLLAGIAAGLRARGLEVLTHRVVPCNDGGLALGQAAVAALSGSPGALRERSEPCASGSPER
ncbi:carbamoyltransferase HypF [Mycolicibacterium rufum]|uniref:Carbamoyltransferase n=1 Tax=Mycolicibacterium rufum TaxID=318424 RepID=A0ABY3UGQ3_9MYCO|nr:carbamoyltransferase HypF [Mycolicibacterium rufum]KGI67825.1 hydrogenase maturation protein HypF [Mycolicibacterium rufum]ULP38804.1 carbamoyltransferase HypF [Mycolicibacterium rufum]